MSEKKPPPIRVLAIDGGGTRGIYTAEYLRLLIESGIRKAGIDAGTVDIGKAFDLIAGTSTGGIIACALALGKPLDHVVRLYRDHAKNIFPGRIPSNDYSFDICQPIRFIKFFIHLLMFAIKRPEVNRSGRIALHNALEEEFGNVTIGDLWDSRRIALCLPAVNIEQASAWVFKTAHLDSSRGRDDTCLIVDACMATTAAPIYRSLASVPCGDLEGNCNIFVDGGLWANNPILLALVDAIRMRGNTRRPIQVYSIGTCAQKKGHILSPSNIDKGPVYWEFGGKAASLSMDAQAGAYTNIAKFLAANIPEIQCSVYRFRGDNPPASLLPYLSLDETSPEGLSALVRQAQHDVDFVWSKADNPNEPESKFLPEFISSIVNTSLETD